MDGGDQIFYWCCSYCGDAGEITFVIDSCRTCYKKLSVEPVNKPKIKPNFKKIKPHDKSGK